MNISAAMVKELRERTGSGMMECKKALVEASGDLESAIEIMRKAGLAKADKKSSRTAAEGTLCVRLSADGKRAAMLELNCETDFVAKNEDFLAYANAVTDCVLESSVSSVEELLATMLPAFGISADERRKELIAKLGENINVRRFERFVADQGVTASYLHGTRIGVLVELEGGTQELGRDIAMHIAASKPVCVEEKDVSAETVAKEKEIFSAQAEASGKPANIIEKMVEGRIKKFLAEITLVGQPYVKDLDQTVGALLKAKGANVVRFARLEVGEGIEKEESNFAEEVMAQVRGG
jgi:elongation factor Ts